MIPDDTNWTAFDTNSPSSHDWANDIARSIDLGELGSNSATWPAPTGTSLAWGGGRILMGRSTQIAAGNDWDADSVLDWRNRWVLCLDFGIDDATDDLPGESSYTASDSHDLTAEDQCSCAMWTGAGAVAGSPPTGNYITPVAVQYVYCDSTDHKLKVRNASGNAYYMWLVVLVSDQFPTRT